MSSLTALEPWQVAIASREKEAAALRTEARALKYQNSALFKEQREPGTDRQSRLPQVDTLITQAMKQRTDREGRLRARINLLEKEIGLIYRNHGGELLEDADQWISIKIDEPITPSESAYLQVAADILLKASKDLVRFFVDLQIRQRTWKQEDLAYLPRVNPTDLAGGLRTAILFHKNDMELVRLREDQTPNSERVEELQRRKERLLQAGYIAGGWGFTRPIPPELPPLQHESGLGRQQSASPDEPATKHVESILQAQEVDITQSVVPLRTRSGVYRRGAFGYRPNSDRHHASGSQPWQQPWRRE